VALAGTGGPNSTLPEGQGKWTITPHHFIMPETEGALSGRDTLIRAKDDFGWPTFP
jgi:hypothetical protein